MRMIEIMDQSKFINILCWMSKGHTYFLIRLMAPDLCGDKESGYCCIGRSVNLCWTCPCSRQYDVLFSIFIIICPGLCGDEGSDHRCIRSVNLCWKCTGSMPNDVLFCIFINRWPGLCGDEDSDCRCIRRSVNRCWKCFGSMLHWHI